VGAHGCLCLTYLCFVLSALQTHNLVGQLIQGCCFPAIAAFNQWQMITFAVSQVALADPTAAAQGGASEQQRAAVYAAATASAVVQAERCVAAARAQGSGSAGSSSSSSREAAFDLLLDLVLHDSGCWQQAQELLQTTVHASAGVMILPNRFNNIPLPSLRAPG
jgi:hypothetical protein